MTISARQVPEIKHSKYFFFTYANVQALNTVFVMYDMVITTRRLKNKFSKVLTHPALRKCPQQSQSGFAITMSQ